MKQRKIPTYLVDANIILRLFSGEPKSHAHQSAALIAEAQSGSIKLKLLPMTLAEVAYVLSGKFFNQSRRDIAAQLIDFISLDYIEIHEQGTLTTALKLFAEHKVDFPDAYLAAQAISQNCGVASFDKDFQKLPVEQVLHPKQISLAG